LEIIVEVELHISVLKIIWLRLNNMLIKMLLLMYKPFIKSCVYNSLLYQDFLQFITVPRLMVN